MERQPDMDSNLLVAIIAAGAGTGSTLLAVWAFTRGRRREQLAEAKEMSARLATFETKHQVVEQYMGGHDGMHDAQLKVLLDIKRAVEGNSNEIAGLNATVRGMEGRMDRQFERDLHAGGPRP